MKTIFKIMLSALMVSNSIFLNAQGVRLVVTTDEGERLEILMLDNSPIELPLRGVDVRTDEVVTFKAKKLNSVELKQGVASDGCRRWDVQEVATPSILLGSKNTEMRLLGLVAYDNVKGATIYKWIVKDNQGNGNNLYWWYGIMLKGNDVVYPFIQNGVVWVRDMIFTFKDSHPDFVKAVNDYYVDANQSLCQQRQAELRRNPLSILNFVK